jgi:hypothetical protein
MIDLRAGGVINSTANSSGSSGGTLAFDTAWQTQRAPLALANSNVYVGFSSMDEGLLSWHGWMMTTTLPSCRKRFVVLESQRHGSFGALRVLVSGRETNRTTAGNLPQPKATSNFNLRTSLILRTDNLLAGKLILPLEGRLPAIVLSSAASRRGIIPAKPNAIPEPKTVRHHRGIAFTLPRMPHPVYGQVMPTCQRLVRSQLAHIHA